MSLLIQKNPNAACEGCLSFQRNGDTSIVADEIMGMNGFYFGARKEYFDAQRFYHASGQSLKYSGEKSRRPFPVPALMTPDRDKKKAELANLDVVIVSDFRVSGDRLAYLSSLITNHIVSNRQIGLVQRYTYNFNSEKITEIAPEIRSKIDGEKVIALVFGDTVSCQKILFECESKIDPSRYSPVIKELSTKIDMHLH